MTDETHAALPAAMFVFASPAAASGAAALMLSEHVVLEVDMSLISADQFSKAYTDLNVWIDALPFVEGYLSGEAPSAAFAPASGRTPSPAL